MSGLRVGVAGLGTASKLILPYFAKVEGVSLAGGADLRAEARAQFEERFGLPAYPSVEELCRAADVDAIWIETPNRLHCEHALMAAEHGNHVICAKPLAITPKECDRMIAAARAHDVRLLVAHSKIFDAPIRAMAELARSGKLGKVVQIGSLLFNDWLRRPRLASELDEKLGEGFILRQAPHLVDIVAHIAGSRAVSVRAMSGGTEPEGHCAGLIAFESGTFASVVMNGQGYFDGSELTFGIGSFGDKRSRTVPRARTDALDSSEKYAVQAPARGPGDAQPFFGLTIVSCEHGVIRQSPQGLLVYTDEGCEEITLPPNQGRAAELIELRDALREKRDVFPNGEWGKANLEICLAILRSAHEGRDVAP